jgi:hypothetical protein
MKPKSFLIRLSWLILASLAIVHIFTVFIDPYQEAGLNAFNRQVVPNDRLDVTTKLEKNGNDFEFFIVGSSRTGGINISALEKTTNQKTFNYSIAAASLEDYIGIINHIAHTPKAKTIYLQLDFYSFKETYSTRRRILETPLKKYLPPYIDWKEDTPKQLLLFKKTYFSLEAFRDAFKTLKKYIKNSIKKNAPSHTTALPKNSPVPEAKSTPPEIVKKGKVRLLKGYFINQYDGFTLNATKLKKWLGFIKKMTADNQINLIVAMSPMNKEHLEKLQSDEKLAKHWLQVKKIIADVFGSYHDFNNCSAGSFQGRLYWRDSVHPSEKLAEVMMRVILDQPLGANIPKSFGMQVTNQTIDKYLSNLNNLCVKE